MSQTIKQIKSAVLFESLKELLNNGQNVKMTVTGNSMQPFLKEGRDSVELAQTCFAEIQLNDVVLIQREDGTYVMHRIIRKEKNCFYMMGDAQDWVEGPLGERNLRARISAIYRKNKKIEVTNQAYKQLVFLWYTVLPLRKIAMKSMRGAAKCLKLIKGN